MNVLFLEEAKREFLDAITYYGQAGVDLGLRFKNEVDQSIKWAAANPELYPLRAGGYRRINLHLFPYYVSYLLREDVFWVLCVSHGRRKPETGLNNE